MQAHSQFNAERKTMNNPTNIPEDLRLAFFFSSKELFRAQSLFREDKEFENIPWDGSIPLSIVMPLKATNLLKKRGLQFNVKEPLGHSLTQEQHGALKKDKAILCRSLFGISFFLERMPLVFEKGGFYVKNRKG